MRRRTPEKGPSPSDEKKEHKEAGEKKVSESQPQKERPTKIERNISSYLKNAEKQEERVEKFLDAKTRMQNDSEVAVARIRVPDRGHEKRKQKDYQAYKEEFEKKKMEADAQLENLEREEQKLERLYKDGPRDAREALAIKRERDGTSPPPGFLGSLRDSMMLAMQGHAIKREVNQMLRQEKKQMRDTETPDRILDIQEKIQSIQKQKEKLSQPETYAEEVEHIKKEERKLFFQYTKETYPNLSPFLEMDTAIVTKKLQDPSVQDTDLFSLMDAIGQARADLIKQHDATGKALEKTRYGYLAAQEGASLPTVDTLIDARLTKLMDDVQKSFQQRMHDSRLKKLDNADMRYMSDKDIAKMASIEASVSKMDARFAKGEKDIRTELIKEREQAQIEAVRAQREVVFHTSREENFLKILEDKLYSMRALKAAHPEKVSAMKATSHDDTYIFFQPEVPSGGYGSGGEKGSAICGFATVEGFLIKSALSTDTGANPGRSEVAVVGVDGAPTVMEPNAFVVYMPESAWKKAQPIIAEKYKDTSPPEVVVYPDSLLHDRSEQGVGQATQEIARLVKERVQEIQKKGGYHVEPGGIRTTNDGYRYYEEDTASW